MKIRIIFSTALAIISFGVLTNAQTHVKAFDGSGYSLLVPAARQSALSKDMPVLNLVAGQPIRVQAGDVSKDGEPDVVVAAGRGGGPHIKTTQIPCESVPAPVVRKSGDDKRQDYLTITLKEVMVSPTDASWKGTCRLLTIELRDGSRYLAKIRFR